SGARDVARVGRRCCSRGRGGGGKGGSVGRRDRSRGEPHLRRLIGPFRGRRLNIVIPPRRGHRTRFREKRRQLEIAIPQGRNKRIESYRDHDCEYSGGREQPVFEASEHGPKLRADVRRRQTETTEAPQKVLF